MSTKIYFIVNDINKPEEQKVRWKDDKKQYFKNYHNQNYECSCGKNIKISSKSYHLKSLKHRLFELENNKINM